MPGDRKAPLRARFPKIWAVFAIGLALTAMIAWVTFLGWLLLQASRSIF
jgi:fumarate reductase subunit D